VDVNKKLQEDYNQFYARDISEWRELGAKAKTKNIIELAKNHSFNKVLELGAGDGSILQKLNDHKIFKELYALEISDSGIEQIKKRELNCLKSIQKFDGYKIPYSDNEFDMVVCSHVIEHVEHPRVLLREIKRISKYQIFEVPIDFSFSADKKVEHFLAYGHINIFNPPLFRFLLKSEGFEIIKGLAKMLDKDVNRNILSSKKKELTFIKYLIFKFKNLAIRLIWKLLPSRLKDLKPQTYTVLTKSTDKILEMK
jgi:ubiquinone/menaquinone biosynthesis C-methylase UbiE